MPTIASRAASRTKPSCALALIVAGSALAAPACGRPLEIDDEPSPDAAAAPDLADLAIDAAASPLSPLQGAEVTLRVRVRNKGPGPAANLVVTVPLLALAEVRLPIAPPPDWTCEAPPAGATGQVVCRTASFAKDASVTTSIVLIWQAGAPKNIMVDVASATPDPESNNNTAVPQSSLP